MCVCAFVASVVYFWQFAVACLHFPEVDASGDHENTAALPSGGSLVIYYMYPCGIAVLCTCMVISGPDSAAGTTSTIRHLDTMTTMTLGQSQECLMDEEDYEKHSCQKGPVITLDKVCAAYYFAMQFDEELPSGCELEIEMPGSDAFLQWLDRTWATDPSTSAVQEDLVWQAFPSNLNPYERQHVLACIAAVNSTWQAVRVYTDVETKTRRLRASINAQVNGMIQRFEEARDSGMINESSLQKKILAAERWRRSKTTEILQHLHEKEEDAMASVLQAAPLLTQLWSTYRSKLEQALSKAATGSQCEPEQHDDMEPASFEEDLEEELLVLELEDTLKEDVRGWVAENPTEPVKDSSAANKI